MKKDKTNAYKEQSENLPEIDQLILIFDKMLAMVNQIKDDISVGDNEAKCLKLEKLLDALHGLQMALDFEKASSAADELNVYYCRIEKMLFKVQTDNDLKLCDQIIYILSKINSLWKEVQGKEIVNSIDLGDFDVLV